MKGPSDQAKLLFLGFLRTATALATDAAGRGVVSQTALFSAAATATLPRRHQQPQPPHLHSAYVPQSSQPVASTAVSPSTSGVTPVQVRLAKLSDVPSVADCNLQTLPENYNHVFYQHHLQEWPDLALVAVVDNNNHHSGNGITNSHQKHWHHFGGGGSSSRLDENHNNHHASGSDDCIVVAYLLGKIQERPKEVLDSNDCSSPYSLLGGTQRRNLNPNNHRIAVERYGHVSSLAVLPDYRRQGLAQLLLQQFHHHLVPQQCSFAGLHVRQSNAAAVKLYERLGYEAAVTIPAYYEDGEDAYYMKKMLPSSVSSTSSSSSSSYAHHSPDHGAGGTASTSQSQSFLESLTARLRPPVRVWESGPEELRLPRTVQVQLPAAPSSQEAEREEQMMQSSCGTELLTGTY